MKNENKQRTVCIMGVLKIKFFELIFSLWRWCWNQGMKAWPLQFLTHGQEDLILLYCFRPMDFLLAMSALPGPYPSLWTHAWHLPWLEALKLNTVYKQTLMYSLTQFFFRRTTAHLLHVMHSFFPFYKIGKNCEDVVNTFVCSLVTNLQFHIWLMISKRVLKLVLILVTGSCIP